jgi:hypothetical protein
MERKIIKNIFAIALFVGVIVLAAVQITGAENVTKTELALFNILQLIFSIGFSWIISSYFSEAGFIESQKKFAIGAFRRIKEIERSISRAQTLLNTDQDERDGKQLHRHQPVMISLMSAQDAVNSSIADWGDIIGDEIHLTKEIIRLKALRKSADKFEKEYLDNLGKSKKEDEDLEREINELKSRLPASLRLEEDNKERIYEMAEYYLNEEMNTTGKIVLTGFWEENDTFSGNLSNVSVGDTLYISRGFTENRRNVLLAYDKEDKWVGVITNKFMSYHDDIDIDYDSFLEFFEHCLDYAFIPKSFGGTPLPIKITEKEEINENGHQYFEAVLNVKDVPINA